MKIQMKTPLEMPFAEWFDVAFEMIRKDYESKGHAVTDIIATNLGKIRRFFEMGEFEIALEPYYLANLLRDYATLKQNYSTTEVEYDNSYDVLGNTSFNARLCRDPFIGPRAYNMALKFYFFDYCDKPSYREVFQALDWQHDNEILTILFYSTPLSSSYAEFETHRRNWEFSSIGALFSTRVAKAFEYSDKESVFLSVLMKNIGRAVLSREFPIQIYPVVDNPGRYLRANREISINQDLFDSILYFLYPLVSAQVAHRLGFSDTIVETIVQHHMKVDKDSKDKMSELLRLVKLVNTLTNFALTQGIPQLTDKNIHEWIDHLGLTIRHSHKITELVKELKYLHLADGGLDQSLINIEARTIVWLTGYERVQDDIGKHSVEHPSNYLQVTKDSLLKFSRKYFLPKEGNLAKYASQMERQYFLYVYYHSKDLEELAKKLEITVYEVKKRLEEIKIITGKEKKERERDELVQSLEGKKMTPAQMMEVFKKKDLEAKEKRKKEEEKNTDSPQKNKPTP